MTKFIKVRNLTADNTFIVNLDNVTHIDIDKKNKQVYFNFAVVEPGSDQYLDYVCADLTEKLEYYLSQSLTDLSY